MGELKGMQAAGDLAEALKAELAVLYKHSPRCPVSAEALIEVQDFARRSPGTPIYMVDVLAAQALSQQVAGQLGIQHESPQVIVVRRGTPVWHASHYEVTAAALAKHVRGE